MSANSETLCEVEPTRAGDGWRVRIIERDRTQFINGFDSREQATRWIALEAGTWINKIRHIAMAR
jgi:hypothetical protein